MQMIYSSYEYISCTFAAFAFGNKCLLKLSVEVKDSQSGGNGPWWKTGWLWYEYYEFMLLIDGHIYIYIFVHTHTSEKKVCKYVPVIAGWLATRRNKLEMHSTDVWNKHMIVIMVYPDGTCFRYALFGRPERLRALRACGNQCVWRGSYWIRRPGNPGDHDKCTAWIPMGACGSSNFYEDHDNNTPRGSDWGKSGNLPRYLEVLYGFLVASHCLGLLPKYVCDFLPFCLVFTCSWPAVLGRFTVNYRYRLLGTLSLWL